MSTTTLVLNGAVGVDRTKTMYRVLSVPFGDKVLPIHVYDQRDKLAFFNSELTALSNAIVECQDEAKRKLLQSAQALLLVKVPEAFRFWYFDRNNKDVVVKGIIAKDEIGMSDRLCYGKQTEDISLKTGKVYKGIKEEDVIARTRLTYSGLDEKGYVTFTCEVGV